MPGTRYCLKQDSKSDLQIHLKSLSFRCHRDSQFGLGITIRIVIALGDIAVQDGDFIGDAFALAARVEAVTPADEI
jgi:class 3 adenylate cyclase